ncbi:MAG: 3-hydroxyacyl-CoA dehydrogenase family protein [Candidatus Margulisiibacteriota bacterium]
MTKGSVLVVGAGVMGTGIASVFNDAGYSLILCDVKSKIGGAPAFGKGMEKIAIEEIEQLRGRDITLVIEAVNEDINLKKAILKELSAVIDPKAVFVSNTSSLSIKELAEASGRKERFAGMHFFNPAKDMKLVELGKTGYLDEAVLAFLKDICASINKTFVVVSDDPGFIVNRVLFSMLNEAFDLAYNKTADIESIDKAIKLGLSHPMGPFKLADFIGLDICYSILSSLEKSTQDPRFKPSQILAEKFAKGEFGRKTGRGFYEY